MTMKSIRQKNTRGSALVVALLLAGVVIAIGAASFTVVNTKYRTVHNAASWQEALLTADAGVDMALNEIRKQLWMPKDAWKGGQWKDKDGNDASMEAVRDGGNAILYHTAEEVLREGSQDVIHGGEGTQKSYALVVVDGPDELEDETGEQWYRITSIGVCELPAASTKSGRAVTGEKADGRLRKFDYLFDRFQEKDKPKSFSAPRATRRIEAIAKPQGAFRAALFGVNTIDLTDHNIVVDSYDSRDDDKSTNGEYDLSKRQWHGDIATNGTVINAGQAHIYGTASTNGGTVLKSDNVTGNFDKDPNAVRNDFYQEVVTIQPPNVTASPGTPPSIDGTYTITASPTDPIQVILSGLKLSGGDTLTIAGAPDGSPTYAQIIVTGDISLTGSSEIILGKGVRVRMFVKGDADIAGNGVTNKGSPLNFQLYGLDRPPLADGSPDIGNIKIAGNGGFRGTVYAPNYDVEMKGGGNTNGDNIYGSFVGNKIRMTGVQSVHYDEALADGGLITGYSIVSWFEDER